MNIVVLGGGAVGMYLSRLLSEEGHDVSVIDSDPEKLEKIKETIDVRAVRGHGSNPRTLRAAGVKDTDLFIGATDSDEINLLASGAARKMGAKQTIARVRNPVYYEDRKASYKDFFEIDHIVNPDELTATDIATQIRTPGAVGVEAFTEGALQMREVTVGARSHLIGKKLKELRFAHIGLIAAIYRSGTIIIPTGDTIFEPDDHAYVIAPPEHMKHLERVLGKPVKELRKVFVLGGTNIGYMLTRMLEREYIQVVMIEHDKKKAKEMSEKLSRTLVLVGDGTDANLLKNENIESADTFVAASDDEEDNIISGLLSKELGAKASTVIVERPEYVGIVQSLGIDVVISPRLLTVNYILKFVRRGNVKSVAVLEKEKVEMIEVVVAHRSEIAGKKLRQANFPKGSIVGSIVRGGKIILPRGDDTVEPGDTLIVFTTVENIPKLEKILM
ncbi:MAG: Trk system potassium transporter TrkA [bacterium]